MIEKKHLLKKVSSTLFVSAMIVLMFTTMSASADGNYYDATNHTMNIVSFATGSLSASIESAHSTPSEINTLRITGGTLNPVDTLWIKSNLVNLGTFEVIEDGAFFANAVPSTMFEYNGNIVNVTFTTVTKVEYSAFMSCGALEYVNLPLVETIEFNSFSECISLSTIIAPNVKTIGSSAFLGSKLETIDFPELISVANGAFYHCNWLANVSMPNVSSIGGMAFNGCNNLTDVYMPNVTTIDSSAFSGSKLETIDVPELISVGFGAFFNCDWLVNVSMPNVTTIGGFAFDDCNNLTDVYMPKVTTFGSGVFDGCSQLDSLTLGSTIPSVADSAVFNGLPATRTLYVPNENISSYKEYDDGDDPASDLWYGWIVCGIDELYYVTYDNNGAIDGFVPVDGSSYLNGTNVTLPGKGDLLKIGYEFSGWNTLADGNGTNYLPGEEFTISGNTTLYANWTAIYFAIYHGTGAISGSAPVDLNIYHLGDEVTVSDQNTLVKTGYVFDGWTTMLDGTGNSYTPGDTFNIDGTVNLYAQWICFVTYDDNNATEGSLPVDVEEYSEGDIVNIMGPSDLLKDGHEFSGWNTADDGSGTNYVQNDTFTILGNTTLYANWTAVYSVTYNANGATSGDVHVDSTVYYLNDEVTVKNENTLVRTGYAFDGWNTAADGTGTDYASLETFEITEDVNLYAQWICFVTYNNNGATSGTVPVDQGNYSEDDSVIVLGQSDLMNTGHEFMGWNTASDGTGTNYVLDDTFTIVCNTTLYANWALNYSVTYNGNGETGGAVPIDGNVYHINDSAFVENQNTLVRTGHVFAGWNSAADGTGSEHAPFDAFVITGDVTLYAQWICYITYDGNDATEGTAPADVSPYPTGTNVTLPGEGDLLKTGHIFTGWNTAVDGSGDNYMPGVEFTMTGNTTFYANWTAVYSVIYDVNGATEWTLPIDPNNPHVTGTNVTVMDGTLARTDYVFDGWNTAADGTGTSYNPAEEFTITSDVTLYAQWICFVTYDDNGATSGSAPSDLYGYSENESVTVLGQNDLLKMDHEFMGWNTAADGNGTNYVQDTSFAASGNVTLYANWMLNCSVTYHANGDVTGSVPVDTVVYHPGDEVTVKTNDTIVRDGYVFAGWNTLADGNGTSYNPTETFNIENDVDLYAQWLKICYVTYYPNNADDGDVPVDNDSPYIEGDMVTVKDQNTLIRNEHGFDGWNTIANGSGTAYQSGEMFGISGNVSLYAQWNVNYYDAGTLTVIDFTTGSISSEIVHVQPALADITTLKVKNGTLDIVDIHWIRDNLTSLETFEVTENGAFVNDTLPNSAFHNNLLGHANITNVTLTTVNVIGDHAFNSCYNLTTLDIPNVISIGDYSVTSCYSLINITAPEVVNIGAFAFEDCYRLESIDMPNLTIASDGAFYDTGFTEVSLPKLTNVSRFMFVSCHNLTSAFLPNVTNIGRYAFHDCTQLDSLTLGSSIPIVDNSSMDIDSVDYVADDRIHVSGISGGTFYGLPTNRILHVPDAAISSYKAYDDGDDPATDLWYGWTVYEEPADRSPSGSGGYYIANPGTDPDNLESSATRTLRISAGVNANYDFSASEGPVFGISFVPMKNVGTVVTRVDVLSNTPSDVTESSGMSYKMMNIEVGRAGTISSSNAKDIIINFKVSKTWIEENNIDISTIRLSRYHADQWNDLPTTQESEDDEYIYFSAETPGFSVFEIKGDIISTSDEKPGQIPVAEPNSDVEDVPIENTKDKNNGYIFLVLGILVVIGAAGYIYWTKQNRGRK
ncbi:outer membrane adhesin like protein [Methanolobus psychrophilus R15]|nr:outer membrane adhesin like protein [Methanolobus psychrophilus R15]